MVENQGLKVNGVSVNFNESDQVNEIDTSIEMPTATANVITITDYMRESLDKVAVAENFQSYKIDVDHGSAVGDGFVGILYKATIVENDGAKQLIVVLKSPPENQARRQAFGAMELFKREVFIYKEILPAFVKFQEERNLKQSACFTHFPKCYLAEYDEEKDDAIIIMEDLKENGYKMWDKFVPVNFEHAKLVVEALGRFHAISFAIREQQPEMFETFKDLSDFTADKFSESNFYAMMVAAIERAADTLDEGDVKRRNRVLKLKEDFSGLMKELTSPKFAEPYAVVTHGDSWSNNFMYHYRRGAPEKVVLLDWQLSRYCSPVLDLVYFIFLSTDGALRATNYDVLINLYHRSLKDFLEHLGIDAMSSFPFTALLRQLKQFGKYGVIIATMILPMFSTKNEDLPDLDFVAENMDNEDPAFKEQMMEAYKKNSDGYQPRMRAVLLDALRLGYLC